MSQSETEIIRDIREDYKYGFSVKEDYFFKSGRGLSHELVEAIAEHKSEPDWMRKFRHQSLDYFFSASGMPSRSQVSRISAGRSSHLSTCFSVGLM